MFGVRKITFLSILIIGALAIAGCASGSSTSSTGAPSSTSVGLPGTGGTGTPAATAPAATDTPMASTGAPAATAGASTPAATSGTATPMASLSTPSAAMGTPMPSAGTPMASTGTPAASASSATVMVYADPMYGQDLVNSQGYTLYIFKNDTPGTSNCTGNCAAIWPPLTVSSGETPTAGPGVTGTLGTIQRSDGSMQVTINDLPLYTYSGDTQAGTAAGQGYKNLWYVLAPDGTPNTTNASSTGTPMAAPMATSTP